MLELCFLGRPCLDHTVYKNLKNVLFHSLDLNDFIERADEGLMTQAQEGDYKSLIRVMEYLQVCFMNL